MKLPSVKSIGMNLVSAFPGMVLVFPFLYLKFKAALATVLVTLASFFILLIINDISLFNAYLVMAFITVSMVVAFKYGLLKEGFLDANPEELANLMSKMTEEEDEKEKEGFSSFPSLSGLSPVIEGYEDVKKEKNETQAPAPQKEELPMPFKLGEIPSQVKNGPHIDAGSTLMKAIKSLNPDQINAMTKDTQQLIETQKSLMGML